MCPSHGRSWCHALVAAGILALTVPTLAGAGAVRRPVGPPVVDPATGEKVVRIPLDWRQLYPFSARFEAAEGGAHVIDLAAIRFTTDNLVSQTASGLRAFAEPDLRSFPPELVRARFDQGPGDLFIAQAPDPAAQSTLRTWLEKSQIEILDYLPQNAYLVRLTPATYGGLIARPDLFWVGLYQPAYRVDARLDYILESDPAHALKLRAQFDLADYASERTLVAALSTVTDVTLIDATRAERYWIVRLAGKAQAARSLAALRGCLWVERLVDFELDNNVARSSAAITTGRGAVAGPIMDVEDVWARGIRGEGQIASAADTGLSTGNLATLHWDFGQQAQPVTNPQRVIKGYALGRTTTWDDNQTTGGGHGTHTSGSIVGNGIRSGSDPSTNNFPSTSFAGNAPKARFVFQSVMDSGGGLGGLPADLTTLFSAPYGDGARVHSNSWGAAVAGQYTTDSQNVDKFVWNNKEMVITFSAGNEGGDGQYWNLANQCRTNGKPIDGVIDTDTIGAPGTAKNCITVGASENYRPTFVYEYPSGDCTPGVTNPRAQQAWNWFDYCSFSVAPIANDLMADNANGLGAFSSRGPTDDGRIKPEVVAPGIAIISTRTDLNQAYEQWGVCNIPAAQQTYYMDMGGTSMANPLTAGAAVLVRQYYVDGWHPNHSATTNPAANAPDGFAPSAALVKATLINGAWDMNPGQYGTGATQEIPPGWDAPHDLPNNAEGFGRVDLEHSLFPGSGWGDDAARKLEVHDVATGLTTGQATNYPITIAGTGDPLIVTLVWTDPYAATGAGTKLVNNLDLEVTSPTATRYYPNRKDWTGGTQDAINNTEQVYVSSPASGSWTVTVRGTAVPGNGQAGTNSQPYALAISGILSTCTPPGKPIITSITDDACARNGLRVYYTAGSGAASHSLVRDGSVVVASYTSGALYDPGDNATHNYVVRALVAGGCFTNSDPMSATDADNSVAAPAAPTVTDREICALTGVDVAWGSVAGATAYDLRVDGSTVVPGVSSPATYLPGNTTSHTYEIRGRNASCTGAWSPSTAGSDRTDCVCTNPPTFAGLTGVSAPGGVACSLHLTWDPASSNCWNGPGVVYNVYRRDAVNPWAPIALCATGTSFDDATALPGTPYDYYVRAEDSTNAAAGACNHGNTSAPDIVASGTIGTISESATAPTLTAPDATPVSGAFSPAFTVASATSATVSYTPSYTSGGVTTDLFGPDDDPFGSGFWTTGGGSSQTATHCSPHTTVYYRINRNSNADLVTGLSTVGYTNVRAIFDYIGLNYSGSDLLRLDYSTDGGTNWIASGWTGTSTSWVCGQSVTLPAGAAGVANLKVRFVNASGGNTRRAGIDYVILRAETVGGPGSWTANAQVELVDPFATATMLKAFGAADANPYTVTSAFSGAGAYQLRLTNNPGGSARVTAAQMNVTGTICSANANVQNVAFLTARATGGQVKLEWQNPSGGSYNAAVVRYNAATAGYPSSPTGGDGGVTCSGQSTSLGSYNSCLHSGLPDGQEVRYTLFVRGGANGPYSTGRSVRATPFATPPAKKWAYSTGATSLAPPGVEWGGAFFAVSNDRTLHAMNGALAGGDWPRSSPYSWMPRATNAPVQHQPPVVPLASGTYVYLASQDGYAYAFDGRTGARRWTSNDGSVDLQLGSMLQADPVGLFAEFQAGAPDRLFVGTRDGSAANTVHALDPLTGRWVYSWNNGFTTPGDGKAIGIITGLSVDYTTNPRRVYFASRTIAGGSANTLWSLDVTAAGATLRRAWALGDIDGAPVAWNGRIYVGTNAGTVYCIDPDSQTPLWSYATGNGPVKGYVYPNFTTPLRLYFSTTSRIWALDAAGALVPGWPVTSIASPTTPQLLLGTNYLLTGNNDGALYEIDVTAPGAASPASVQLGSGQIGAAALDSSDPANLLAIVGSTAGTVYAVKVPW